MNTRNALSAARKTAMGMNFDQSPADHNLKLLKLIDKKKKEIDSMKKNKDDYKIDPRFTSIKKKEQRKMERLRRKANMADDLQGVSES